MELRLNPEQFPTIRYRAESGILFSDIGAVICALIALGYWLLRDISKAWIYRTVDFFIFLLAQKAEKSCSPKNNSAACFIR